MRINGNTYTAEVTSTSRLKTASKAEPPLAVASHRGESFSIITTDAGPVANEYTLYIKNDHGTKLFHIADVWSYGTDADVVWKFHKVTGTAAGASVVTPVNLNTSSGTTPQLTCRGGAGGVTGLTSSDVIMHWYNGIANTTYKWGVDDSIVIGPDTAVAIEYDAGTGGAAMLTVIGYFEENDE